MNLLNVKKYDIMDKLCDDQYWYNKNYYSFFIQL